jgi:hypothetical protein
MLLFDRESNLRLYEPFLEKCHLVRDISIFSALPGAHAPGRVHSPPKAGRKEKISKLEFLLFRRKFLVVGEVVVAYGCDSVSTPEH